jgi:hypothetical protein
MDKGACRVSTFLLRPTARFVPRDPEHRKAAPHSRFCPTPRGLGFLSGLVMQRKARVCSDGREAPSQGIGCVVKPEDSTEASATPRDVERHLVVEWIPKENLLLGARVFDLQGTLSGYKSDWKVVSHAFDIQEDGSALLTCILEKARG